jgi:hypothetical protein
MPSVDRSQSTNGPPRVHIFRLRPGPPPLERIKLKPRHEDIELMVFQSEKRHIRQQIEEAKYDLPSLDGSVTVSD